MTDGRDASLQELPEGALIQSGVPDYPAHGERVDRIMARDREDSDTVRHDDVPSLARDTEAGLFEGANRVEVVDAGDFRHTLRHVDLADHVALEQLLTDHEVLPDGAPDVRQRLRFVRALRPAAG
jgi:hypothetical protein